MNNVFRKGVCQNHCRSQCHSCDNRAKDCCSCNNSYQTGPMDIDLQRVVGTIHKERIDELANNFLEEYYDKVGRIGWNAIQHIYIPDSVITCNCHVYSGGHEFLNALSNEYIKRANFGGLGATWSQIDESKIMITVFGEIQFIGFTGDCSGIGNFSDTFIINAFSNDVCAVTHHNFNFK